MPLQAGTRLGPYEVVAPLGAGGMGEVYRARDTRLGREVAIKVLPAALASDPERLKRIEREARSASALSHPNIVTIYDVGTADSVYYMAMELVVGEPLRSVLLRGALPVRRLLQLGSQLADGLAKAHAAGIVHRDLKPENVMLTEDGLVKILDFGLAKLTQPESTGSEMTQAPTMSGATEAGVVLGTVGYMSPEQAAGGAVDYRSDQFSFGSILYEMATGRKAFRRASTPQTLAAIIQEEPDPIASQNPAIPAPVRWVVERCLAKEPRSRYASTEDLARELATIRDHLGDVSGPAAASPAGAGTTERGRLRIPIAVGAAVLAALGVVLWRLVPGTESWRNPLAGAVVSRLTDWEGSEADAAISTDGKFVAFLSDRGGLFDVWATQVGSNEFLDLTGGRFPDLYNDRIRNLGFSGDGSHVALRVGATGGATDDTWLVPTIGGALRPFLRDAVEVAWSPDGTRVVYHSSDPGDPLFVADRGGTDPRRIFESEAGIHNHFPIWSPDGRYIYFVHGVPSPPEMDLWRIPAAGGTADRLTRFAARVASPAFLDSRTLLFTAPRPDGSGSALYAMDVERRIPHAVSFGLEEYTSVAASADGRRFAVTVGNPTSHLWTARISDRVVDDSEVRPFSLPAVRAAAPRYGKGDLFFLSSKGGVSGLWKFRDGADTELWKGADGSVAAAPAVSPDGTRIAFVVREGKQGRLHVMAADGTGARRVDDSLDVRDAPTWSPDGKWIAVVAAEGEEQPLFRIPTAGGSPERLVGGVNFDPVWAPDGRFIAYSEHRGGPTYELKGVTPEKRPIALPELRVRAGGNRYRFLPGGRALIVLEGSNRQQDFWLLDLATGRQRPLTRLRPGFDIQRFDVSPDGKEILFDRFRENSDVVLIDVPRR